MKYKTLKSLNSHPAVYSVTRNYDGYGTNMVELKEGWTCWDAGSIIGDAKTILSDIENHLQKQIES